MSTHLNPVCACMCSRHLTDALEGTSLQLQRIEPNSLICWSTQPVLYIMTTKVDDPHIQKRVFLWSNPRSLSTVFEKCISSLHGTQIINEPFSAAHDLGPDRAPVPDFVNVDIGKAYFSHYEGIPRAENHAEFINAFDHDICSYEFVKNKLERPYCDKSLVFCKDLCYGIHNKYHMLPVGYRHTFLIRDPRKTLVSWLKLMQDMTKCKQLDVVEADALFPALEGAMQQYELFKFLQSRGDDVIVIDADDLQNDPETILRKYCDSVGIRFQSTMLRWESGDEAMRDWISALSYLVGNKNGGYYSAAMKSMSFEPSKAPRKRNEIPCELWTYVDSSMPFYRKMHDIRLPID